MHYFTICMIRLVSMVLADASHHSAPLCILHIAALYAAGYPSCRVCDQASKIGRTPQDIAPVLTSSVGSVPLYCDSAACRERRVAARWIAISCSSGAKIRPAYLSVQAELPFMLAMTRWQGTILRAAHIQGLPHPLVKVSTSVANSQSNKAV